MRVKTIGSGINAGNGAAVEMAATPFLPGREAVLVMTASDNWDRSVKIQDSDDGTTWADVANAVLAADAPNLVMEITLKKYYRYSVTVAGTAGTADIKVIN